MPSAAATSAGRVPRLLDDAPTGTGQVFTAQFFFLSALALPIAAVVVVGAEIDETLFASMLALAGLTAILSGVQGRTQAWESWALALPVLDILVCLGLYVAAPGAGFAVLLALPVAWIVSSHEWQVASVVVATTAVSVLLVPVGRVTEGTPWAQAGLPAAANVVILLVLVTLAARARTRRSGAQRQLLRRQTQMLTSALERATMQEGVLSEVLDAIDVVVLTIGPEGTVDTHNRAADTLARRLGGRSVADLASIPLYGADRVTPVPPGEGPFARTRSARLVHDVLWLGHPGENRIALSVSQRGVGEAGGRSVVIARDITSEVVTTDERDDLVTSISHEIRTPLSSILGYLELVLEHDDLDAEVREMVQVALDNTERLITISQDFLSARSTSSSSTMTLSPEPCVPALLVGQAVEMMRPVALERLISLVVGPLDHAEIDADPLRLRQVVDNLLSNAIKYNRFGGRVNIDLEPGADGGLVLRVGDNGRGMDEHDQQQLFTRFFRADAARASGVAGSGIGLSITREIVDLHHGTIDVSSRVDEGTTVTVHLPGTPLHSPEEQP